MEDLLGYGLCVILFVGIIILLRCTMNNARRQGLEMVEHIEVAQVRIRGLIAKEDDWAKRGQYNEVLGVLVMFKSMLQKNPNAFIFCANKLEMIDDLLWPEANITVDELYGNFHFTSDPDRIIQGGV